MLFLSRICVAGGVHISTSAIILQGENGEKFSGTFALSYLPDEELENEENKKKDKKKDEEIHLETGLKTWFEIEENKDIPLHSWLRVYPEDIVLKPGKTVDVHYNVTVPPDAQGYLMAVAAFETIPQKEEEEKSEESEAGEDVSEEATELQPPDRNTPEKEEEEDDDEEEIIMYSVPVYLLVDGTINLDCSVLGIELLRDENIVSGTVELENTGNVFLLPGLVEMRLRDEEENEIAVLTSENGQLPVFPKKTAVYEVAGEAGEINKGEYYLSLLMRSKTPEFEYTQERIVQVKKDGSFTIYTAEKEE